RRGGSPGAASLDDPVGALEQRRRNVDGNTSRGAEIHHQLQARRAPDSQLGGLGASQNSVHELRGLTEDVGPVRAVGQAAAGVRGSPAPLALVERQSTTARVSLGTTWRKKSRRRAFSSGANVVSPVRFVSGFAGSRASPGAAGSSMETMTIGTVFVACRAAAMACGPTATITATFRRTRSSACC